LLRNRTDGNPISTAGVKVGDRGVGVEVRELSRRAHPLTGQVTDVWRCVIFLHARAITTTNMSLVH
jgi:hypothetical protein